MNSSTNSFIPLSHQTKWCDKGYKINKSLKRESVMKIIVTVTLYAMLLVGCASGLSSMQQQELQGYETKGLAIQEKSTSTATALGFLPGGGSFYTRNYGLGVLNLLTWPYSVLWDPVSGYNGAQEINYHATVANVNKLKDAEMAELESQLMMQRIDNNQFLFKKHEIERKYSSVGNAVNSQMFNTDILPLKDKELDKEKAVDVSPLSVTKPTQSIKSVYENKINNPPIHQEGDLRDCLTLKTNEEVVKCTERR